MQGQKQPIPKTQNPPLIPKKRCQQIPSKTNHSHKPNNHNEDKLKPLSTSAGEQNNQNQIYEQPIKKLINSINLQTILNNMNKILSIKSTKVQQKYKQKYQYPGQQVSHQKNIYTFPIELQVTSSTFLTERQKYHTLLNNHHMNLTNIRSNTTNGYLNIFECLQQQHQLLHTTMKIFTQFLLKQCQQKGLLLQVLTQQHLYLYDGLLEYMDIKLKNDLRNRIRQQSQIQNQLGEEIQKLKIQMKSLTCQKDRKWKNLFMLIKDNRILRRTRGKLMRQIQASRIRQKLCKQNLIQLTKQIQRYKLLTFSAQYQEDGLQKWLKNLSSLMKIQRYIQKQPNKAKRVLQYELENLQISQMQALPQKIEYIIKSIQQAEQLVDYYQDLNDLITPSKLLLNNYTQTQLQNAQKSTNTPIFKQDNKYCQARVKDMLQNNLDLCSNVCMISVHMDKIKKNDLLLSKRKVSSSSQRLFPISTKNTNIHQNTIINTQAHTTNSKPILNLINTISQTIKPKYIPRSMHPNFQMVRNGGVVYCDSKFVKKLDIKYKQVQVIVNGYRGFVNLQDKLALKNAKSLLQKTSLESISQQNQQQNILTLKSSLKSSNQLELNYQNPNKSSHAYLLKAQKHKRYSYNNTNTISNLQNKLKRISNFAGDQNNDNYSNTQQYYPQQLQDINNYVSKQKRNSLSLNKKQQKIVKNLLSNPQQNLHNVQNKNKIKDNDIISQQLSYISDITQENSRIRSNMRNVGERIISITNQANNESNGNMNKKQNIKTEPHKTQEQVKNQTQRPQQSNSFNLNIKVKNNSKQKFIQSQQKIKKQSLLNPNSTSSINQTKQRRNSNANQKLRRNSVQRKQISPSPSSIPQISLTKRDSYQVSIFRSNANSSQRQLTNNEINTTTQYQSEIENDQYTDIDTLSNVSSKSALNRYYMTNYGKNIKDKLFANVTNIDKNGKKNRNGEFGKKNSIDANGHKSPINRKKISQNIAYYDNKNNNSLLLTGRISELPIPIQQLVEQNQQQQSPQSQQQINDPYTKQNNIKRINRNSKINPSCLNISSKTYFQLENQNNIVINLDPNKIIPKLVHLLYINRFQLKNSPKTLKQYIETNLRNIYGNNISTNNTHIYFLIFNKYLALEIQSHSFSQCFIRMLNSHAPTTYLCDILKIYLIILDKCGSQTMLVQLQKAVMIINYINQIFFNQKQVQHKVQSMQSTLMIISMNNIQKNTKNKNRCNNINKLTNLTINLNMYFLILEAQLRDICLKTQFYKYCRNILPQNQVDLNFQQIQEIIKFLPYTLEVQLHLCRLKLYLLRQNKQKDQVKDQNSNPILKQKNKQSHKLSAMKLHKLSLYTHRQKWKNLTNILTIIQNTFKSTMQFNLSLEQLIDLINRLDGLEFGENRVRSVCPWLYGLCRNQIRRYKDYGIKLNRSLLMSVWLTQVKLRVDSYQILGQKLQFLCQKSRKILIKKQVQQFQNPKQIPTSYPKSQTQKQQKCDPIILTKNKNKLFLNKIEEISFI